MSGHGFVDLHPRARDYDGPDDLRRMQELAVACARADGELAHLTAGDLAWWMYQHRNKLDEVRIRLWEDERGLAAFGWAWLPGVLFLHVRPDVRSPRAVDEVLDWFEDELPGEDGALSVVCLDRDPLVPDALRARGYRLTGEDRMAHLVRGLHDLPEPEVPAGYTLRHVRLPADVHERAEVHRQAFAPSRVADTTYWIVTRTWPYRAALDWVVEAPDGGFAAFCLVWLDEENGLAEMEPVGTHPRHRRRGLARAACLAALRAAREAGAARAVVYANLGSGGEALYRGLGFAKVAEHVRFRRERSR